MTEPVEHPDPLRPEGIRALRRAVAVRRADRAFRVAEAALRAREATGRAANATTTSPDATTSPEAPTPTLDVTAGNAVSAGVEPPPAGLAARILGGAVAARPAGRPTGPWASEEIGPVEALERTVADLVALLDELRDEDWDRPIEAEGAAGWTVRDVVAHLVAVEAYQTAVLGHGSWTPPPGTEADHTAMTGPTVDELRTVPVAELRRRWDEAVAASLAAARTEAARPGRLRERLTFAGLPFRVATLMVVRTFEVWTHTDDIRRAVGRPVGAPDGSRLTLMSDLAVNALPLGLALSGRPGAQRTARIVLTGPGGGSWSQALGIGDTAGEPEVVVVADVVDFCRLAAKRLPADELVCHIEGDEQLAADLLVGAAVFAA